MRAPQDDPPRRLRSWRLPSWPVRGWRAAGPVLRLLAPWLLAVAASVALFLGWYGVSGTPVPAKQLPYLVSGGLTGVALMVLAAAAFATGDVRRRLADLDRVERKIDSLYALLTEELAAVPAAEPGGLVALDRGTSYHLAGCRLVTGKPAARPVAPEDVATRGLRPCRLCDPPATAAA